MIKLFLQPFQKGGVFFLSVLLLFACDSSQPSEKPNPKLDYERLGTDLMSVYSEFYQPGISRKRTKPKKIAQLVDSLQQVKDLTVQHQGNSIEGRPIYSISLGSGPINVMLWSQMHGDEATATRSIFDMLHFLTRSHSGDSLAKQILSACTLHFIPMLNPDGAERFNRRNAIGVDLNRDALRLQNPESIILKRVRDSLEADFAFNLHDQGRRYRAGDHPHPATISFLATAYNEEKEVNETRKAAMQSILAMNELLQGIIPKHVGKYKDDFEPRAFGDNIAKWGSALILIESGGYGTDHEKEEIRKFNFAAILGGLAAIAYADLNNFDHQAYYEIPDNSFGMYDLIAREVILEKEGKTYLVDVASSWTEHNMANSEDFYISGSIADIGDLSTSTGYLEIQGQGKLKLKEGKVYPQPFSSLKQLSNEKVYQLLKEGYSTIRLNTKVGYSQLENFPLNVITSGRNFKTHDFELYRAAHFLLEGENGCEFAVINGQWVDIINQKHLIKNSSIY